MKLYLLSDERDMNEMDTLAHAGGVYLIDIRQNAANTSWLAARYGYLYVHVEINELGLRIISQLLKHLDGCLIYTRLDRAKRIASELARRNAGLEIKEKIDEIH